MARAMQASGLIFMHISVSNISFKIEIDVILVRLQRVGVYLLLAFEG